MKLTYTATLEQTDADFNAIGQAYSFSGVQTVGVVSPQSADLTALATAMMNDIAAQMQAKYPVEAIDDGGNAAQGGQD